MGSPRPGLCVHLARAALPGKQEAPCRSETGLWAAGALEGFRVPLSLPAWGGDTSQVKGLQMGVESLH